MKKIIVLLFGIFLLFGCTKINDLQYDEIVNEIIASKNSLVNQYRTGYKYYLPRGLRTEDNKEFNEKLSNQKENYYLYIDIVSYYNEVKETYTESPDAYFSKGFIFENKYGYLEINKIEENYLIEMMYNYAKIEVIVKEENLKTAIMNTSLILSSIQYNNSIINNLVGEDVLNYDEVEINIFETTKGESNTLKYDEEYGTYEEVETEVPDTDLIR